MARRGRPFERAWRALRAPAGGAAEPAVRAAFQHLHRALNASAGAVLFEHGIDAFVAAQPRYAPLRGDLTLFFQSSKQQFFGGGSGLAPQQRLQWLRDFCRRCRDAERGAA
jgi:mxaA protein